MVGQLTATNSIPADRNDASRIWRSSLGSAQVPDRFLLGMGDRAAFDCRDYFLSMMSCEDGKGTRPEAATKSRDPNFSHLETLCIALGY